MAQTRLDRLLVILDTGQTPITRKAAGTQLGEVQKLHPHELPNLLSRVHVYLKSKNWDTRVAAAHAIECIASNVPQWNPDGVKIKEEQENGVVKSEWQSTFVKLDIRTVLERGEKLLGSAGDEFEHDAASGGLTSQESVSRQHSLLRKQIGGGLDVGVDDLLDDDDLILHPVHETLPKQESVESAEDVVMSQIDAITSDGQLSSREKNRAKRRMKMMAKQKSKDKDKEKIKSKSNSFDCGADVRPPPEKIQRRHNSVLVKQKSEHGSVDEKPIIPHQQTVLVKQPSDDDKIVLDSVTDNTMAFTEMVEWPFENFCSDLCDDLFSPVWEIRHGAASALRELIKLHGGGAGKSRETPVTKMTEANIEWLEVMSWKLLCIFALDQFTDFVTDEVVAPVRETTAQTLGAVLHHLNNDSITRILHVLIQLQEHDQWQVRHGGLLGLKYMLAIAVQKKMVDELLPQALPWVMKGLQDVDDDIRGLAAASLLPVSEVLGQDYQKESLQILDNLWDILHEPDELTASTNSVMSLLSSLITVQIKTSESMSCCVNFGDLVPRLWPFFKHNITSVRMSSLKTMKVLLEISNDTTWMEQRLSEHLQQVFQRIILEQTENIREMACEVWSLMVSNAKLETLQQTVRHHSTAWFLLLIQPYDRPFDPSLLTYTAMNGGGANHQNGHSNSGGGGGSQAYYISSINFSMDASEKDAAVIETRLAGSNAISKVFSRLSMTATNSSALSILLSTIETLLSSQSALKIIVAAMIVQEWAKCRDVSSQISDTILLRLQTLLSNQMVYEEVMNHYQRLQIDTQSLIYAFQEQGIDITVGIPPGSYSPETSSEIANNKYNEFVPQLPKTALQGAQTKQKTLLSTIAVMQKEYTKLNTRVLSSIAGALISLNKLTPKLSPIVQPLMGSVKKEEDILMRNRNAIALAQLMMLCVSRTPSPNNKIIKNLSTIVCCDKKQTPALEIQSVDSSVKREENEMPKCTTKFGILTLQKKLEAATINESKRSLGRSASVQKQSSIDGEVDEASARLLQVQRQGAAVALSTCVEVMGTELQSLLPSLWSTTFDVLKDKIRTSNDMNSVVFAIEELDLLITAMQVLEVTGTSFHTNIKERLLEILPNIITALSYPYTSVRHMASRCIGVVSKILTTQTMDLVLSKLIDVLGESDNLIGRQGSIEALVQIIDSLALGILPYLVLLIVPILGRMSDQAQDVRLMATNCFAGLVQLMPLESGVSNPPGMSQELIEKKTSQRHFLEQLMNPTKLDMFNIPIPIDCTLRKYQQDGVNWLAFLNKYNLHGILCDDMGLGKTLQSICIVAGDHYNSMKKYKISGKMEFKPLPSLIVCPPTLTGHWCYEVKKFCKKEHLNPLHYMGPPADRMKLQPLLCNHNIVVASYDIIRNDSDFFLSKHWNYCILDEGHIIKNSKTKLSKVIKMLNANHRLILSGTPIQNNVLELWSLFDFLMPGFLGSEKEFTAKFGKPILQSRDAKSSSKEQEAGALAMERLHKQTLPFLLRRIKEDVLQDLPPKIIQDYYCDLSPLQMELYEDFSRTQAKKNIEMDVSSEDFDNLQKKQSSTHIFQALQYLRKVCNHPSLVLTRNHPEYESVITKLQMQKSSLQDIQHSGKLVALKQLLLDCGIGVTENSSTENDLSSVVSQHRALIFCQLKSMIDIIENDLFKSHMPSVTYSKLDGSIAAGQRQGVVQKFNNDPSIDVLLLTTHVGGLGLNLTGADTVIFVEHDWNPMKDLQAMDRAHRIGQKKVVNVYKLIARGTLEEKIMGLQKFKMNIANTVISQDNSSLQSMDTSQVLDLFTVDSTKGDDQKKRGADSGKKSVSIKEIVEEAGELWDEKQYESEYNLDNFMESLAADKN